MIFKIEDWHLTGPNRVRDYSYTDYITPPLVAPVHDLHFTYGVYIKSSKWVWVNKINIII